MPVGCLLLHVVHLPLRRPPSAQKRPLWTGSGCTIPCYPERSCWWCVLVRPVAVCGVSARAICALRCVPLAIVHSALAHVSVVRTETPPNGT